MCKDLLVSLVPVINSALCSCCGMSLCGTTTIRVVSRVRARYEFQNVYIGRAY